MYVYASNRGVYYITEDASGEAEEVKVSSDVKIAVFGAGTFNLLKANENCIVEGLAIHDVEWNFIPEKIFDLESSEYLDQPVFEAIVKKYFSLK